MSKCLLVSWLQSPSAVILEPPKIKPDTVSTVSPSICHDVMGQEAMILVFWMLSFKPTFSLSSFTFIKRLFSSSSLSAIRVVSSPYLRLLIFLPAILIPACASSSPGFLMMYFAYKLNKQGDDIQPWRTPCPIWNQSVVHVHACEINAAYLQIFYMFSSILYMVPYLSLKSLDPVIYFRRSKVFLCIIYLSKYQEHRKVEKVTLTVSRCVCHHWAPKNWCFWTVVLEKTLEGPLDRKEIQPNPHPTGNQSWIFIGRTDAEAETPILWPPDAKNWLIGKDPEAGKDWRWEEKGMTEDVMVG